MNQIELFECVKNIDFFSRGEQMAILERLAFDFYLRKGFIPDWVAKLRRIAAVAPIGYKFNPWHDPHSGEFTSGPSDVTPVSDTVGATPRPAGVPDNWIETPTKPLGGAQFTDPNNSGNYVRVMPGDPNSQFPNSRAPYVRWQLNGQALDANGEPLPSAKVPEAHIPLDEFDIPLDFFEP